MSVCRVIVSTAACIALMAMVGCEARPPATHPQADDAWRWHPAECRQCPHWRAADRRPPHNAAGRLTHPRLEEGVYRLKKVPDLPAELTARMDRAPWSTIPDFPPMTLVGTNRGKPRYRSRVKACWNDTGVRILWHFEDPDVTALFDGRDEELWRDDGAEILLAPDGDRTRYYEISFNARGAAFDGAICNPNIKRDDAWAVEPAWSCEGMRWRATGEGRFNGSANRDRWWAVEAEIPFAGLGMLPPRAGDVWTAGVFRVDNGPPLEWHSWTEMPLRRPGFHQSDRFGLWIFEE